MPDIREEFITDKTRCEAANHRAHYDPDEIHIEYFLPFMMEGPIDVCDTITHEWIHALIDWGLLGPNGEYTEEWFTHYEHDPEGDTDHYIIKLINYG